MSEFKYSNLIKELVYRDIAKKYRRSIFGVLWSMLNPLMMMIITAMVFSNLFRFEIQNFALYLLSGQIIFTFYAEATNFAMASIVDNGSLIRKVYLPKYLFPLSRVVSSGVNLLFSIPALLLIMMFTGAEISFRLFFSFIPLILLFIFSLGIGLILSAVAVFFRDLFHLYGVMLTALNYATPIFYPASIIPVEYQSLIQLNPLTHYLDLFRKIVYSNSYIGIEDLLLCSTISFLSLGIGILIFKKLQKDFVIYV